MRYVAAYLLAVLGGKEAPATGDIEKILSSVGIEVDATRLAQVVAQLKGKSIEELIKEGREKLSALPVGGGAAAAAAPVAAAEEKKEDKKSKFNSPVYTCFSSILYCDEFFITIFRMKRCDSK